MNRFIYLLIFLLASGQFGLAQSSERSTDYAELRDNFEAETPNTKQLSAFDQRAEQKLNDFVSLLDFYYKQTDTSLASFFIETANTYFIEEATFSATPISTDLKYPTTKFIQLLASKDIYFDVNGVSITPNSNLTKVNQETYSGSLIVDFKNIKTSDQTPQLLVDYYLLKTQKAFGSRTRKVWEVKLGDIREPRPISNKPGTKYSGNPGSGY